MGQLEDLITRCDRALAGDASKEDRALIVGDYVLGYQKVIFNVTGVQIDKKRCPDPNLVDDNTIRSIRTMLMAHKERLDHELAVANANAAYANMNFAQTQTVTTTITYMQTINRMNELPADVLSTDQKKELASLLSEFEENKDKGAGKLAKADKAVADWLFDQGIKAIPTVMPYLTQVVQSVVSA